MWWHDDGDSIIRITSIETVRSHMSVTASLLDADGGLIPEPPLPPPTWHPSARYFRLSQTSTDLFDAYRNAFMALEPILDHVHPHGVKANGKPDGAEGHWFKAALQEADKTTPLSSFVPAGTLALIEWLYEFVYGGVRSAMSHAKQLRPTLLPRDDAQRAVVVAGLEPRGRLLIAETASRLEDVDALSEPLERLGFDVANDEPRDRFIRLTAVKADRSPWGDTTLPL